MLVPVFHGQVDHSQREGEERNGRARDERSRSGGVSGEVDGDAHREGVNPRRAAVESDVGEN